MQPPSPNLSDPHHDLPTQYSSSSYYSHFPTQNPNPYPLHRHHQLPIESQINRTAINPALPVTDPYMPPYPMNHAGGVTYAQTIRSAAPATYGKNQSASQYLQGGKINQDGTQQRRPPTHIPTMWANPTVRPHRLWKKVPKKTKITLPATCEVCKIECNTKDVLEQHKLGKKHTKNLEKLKVAMAVPSNPIIGPLENPNNGNSVSEQKKTVAADAPEDQEIKLKQVLEGGAAANDLRTCEICNVVCNSDTVFRFHLAGNRHSSMLKKTSRSVAATASITR